MHHFATEEVRTSPRVIQWNLSIVATDTESSHFAMATSPDPSCTNPVQVVYIQPTAYIKTKKCWSPGKHYIQVPLGLVHTEWLV